jgi:hypothetical protein
MAFHRILMSPADLDGGGDLTPDGEMVSIPRAELDALRASAATAPTRPVEIESALARELAERERRLDDLERDYRGALLDRELATALAGKPLIPGAAAQLIKLWREDFEVYDDGGERKVASRDGQAVAEAVAQRLASPEYGHFCQPSSRGGTAARGINRPAPPPPAGPRTLGKAAVQQWHEAAASRRADGLSAPISLGRRR